MIAPGFGAPRSDDIGPAAPIEVIAAMIVGATKATPSDDALHDLEPYHAVVFREAV